MKSYFICILFCLLTLFACKKRQLTVDEVIDTGNLDEIKNTKAQIEKRYENDRKDLAKLQDAIVRLDSTQKQYKLVTAIPPVDTIFNHYIDVQGSVQTKNDALIYPEYSGVMTQLMVQEGQYISKGTLIAKIDDGGLNQQIAQQQVQLELAKTTYERQKRLWEQNIGSEMQYLQAKNNYEAMQKGISALQQQLKKVNVYAPFSGSVEEIITQQGQVVAPGATPILRLVSLGSLYVEADVPENYLRTVQRGTKTLVEMEAIGLEYNSTVKRVNSTINPASRAFTIEVGVPSNKLIKPNLIASLKINDYTNKDALLVPSNIIREDAQGNQYLFVIDSVAISNNIYEAHIRNVELGEMDDQGRVEILSGLEPGQRVVEEGAKNLLDGDEVEVLDYSTEE